MCESSDFDDTAPKGLTRRSFGVLSAGAAVTACAPAALDGAASPIGGLAVEERAVNFTTHDGTMDAVFFHPAKGAHPAVLMWPDIASVRPAQMAMARRTASHGYSVLLVNPYYRDVAGQQFADFAAFRADDGFAKVTPWREKLDAKAIYRDTDSAMGWLDMQDAVDSKRGAAAEGYCMGGPFTVWSAVGVPDRIRAAASFHGGGLVREGADDSPHALLKTTRAALLIAIAQNDDARAPAVKNIFGAAADAAKLSFEQEVYAADHGWTVPDSPAYLEAEAERAFARKLALYERALT